MSVVGHSASKVGSQVWYSSISDQPRRVLIDTGRLVFVWALR